MKTAIIYKSILGATRKYAQWLSESVESDLFKSGKVSEQRLQEYELVILCSATYMGWILLRGYLEKRWPVLQGKKVILLVIGMAPQEDAESEKAFQKIPEHIRENIRYFKLPGKIGSSNADQVTREKLQPILEYVSSLAA